MFGIVDWILGKDLSSDWTRDPNFRVYVDLDQAAICGVRSGQSPQLLTGLGRAEDGSQARQGNLLYYSQGLIVHICDEMLDAFSLNFRQPGYEPFMGTIRWHGQPVSLNGESTVEDVRRILGPEETTLEEFDELELGYNRDRDTEFEVIFDDQQRLQSIDVL